MNKHVQLPTSSASSSIYDVLRRDLVGGRFKAGEKLAINAVNGTPTRYRHVGVVAKY